MEPTVKLQTNSGINSPKGTGCSWTTCLLVLSCSTVTNKLARTTVDSFNLKSYRGKQLVVNDKLMIFKDYKIIIH